MSRDFSTETDPLQASVPVGHGGKGRAEHHHSSERLEATINALSSLLSVASIIVLLAHQRAMLFVFQTWVPFVPAVRHADTVRLMDDFREAVEQRCDVPALPIAVFDVTVATETVTRAYTIMPLAYGMTNVSPSLMLLWVLAVSAAFQTYRASHIVLPQSWDALEVRFVLWGPHILVHTAIWIRVLEIQIDGVDWQLKLGFCIATLFTCVRILTWANNYVSSAPDFGRWLEYTLTAPLQVVIVALSVWARDRSTLYALGAAQASMMLCGVVTEDCVATIYETNRRQSPIAFSSRASNSHSGQHAEPDASETHALTGSETRQRRRAIHTALATLVVAWFSFTLI